MKKFFAEICRKNGIAKRVVSMSLALLMVLSTLQALPAGIINTIVYIVLLFDVYFFYIQDTKFSIVALAVTFAFLFIFTIILFSTENFVQLIFIYIIAIISLSV